MAVDSELLAILERVFVCCRVQEGEVAALLTDAGTRPEYVEGATLALGRLGAHVFQVMIPSGGGGRGAPVSGQAAMGRGVLSALPPAVQALKHSEFVLDLTTGKAGLIHDPARGPILSAGARVLVLQEHPEVLRRWPPSEDVKRRVQRSAALIEGAREMHVTSPAGTDLRVDLDGVVVRQQYGFADAPGRLDAYPSGIVAAYPTACRAHGTVVMDVGDIDLTFMKYLQSPIHFTLEDDFVTRIEGSGLDAEVMRTYMESWGERNAFGLSHVGWGLAERAQWSALALHQHEKTQGMDGRAFLGNFMWSTGPNPYVGRETGCHFDLPMRHCSVALDGRPIIEDGQFVLDELLASA